VICVHGSAGTCRVVMMTGSLDHSYVGRIAAYTYSEQGRGIEIDAEWSVRQPKCAEQSESV
jgi:hypothetical protein